MKLLPIYSSVALLLGCAFADAQTVRYNRDVRPILSENCLACHGPDANKRKAGLRLDVRAVALATREGRPAAIVPGDLAASTLLQRVTAHDANQLMPPPDVKPALNTQQIETLRTWIAEGAFYEEHWAFISPQRTEPPAVRDGIWAKTPVDGFILASLEAQGIAPSPEAGLPTLIRRVYLDLIGLLPPPEAVAAFVADARPEAYEQVVDGLLASPHFGERWGRHWLDAARYADSNGYSIDGPRSIWKYRDWVIDALNRGLPFDQFVIEQLAGDLLPDATEQQRVATGFHRNTMINQEGGIDPEEFRIAAVIDRTNTTASVFLGLTMACAQCHTHKYDPIEHDEYYRFLAFFNSDDEIDIELPTEEQRPKWAETRARIAELTAAAEAHLKDDLDAKLAAWVTGLTEEAKKAFSAEEQRNLALAPELRTAKEKSKLIDLYKQQDAGYQALLAPIKEAEKELPEVVKSMVLTKRAQPRETNLFTAGDFTRPAQLVTPGVPRVLNPLPAVENPTRLDLAKWIVDPANPLTARVTVNRMWQHLFGRGIVETENDFGLQGLLPADQELLDWLATDFVARGWDYKGMLRVMVLSATYRQASNTRPDLATVDPDNRLLARQTRLRLDAEIIRDAALSSSGLLAPAIGGPGVYPPQPDGVMTLGQMNRTWDTSQGPERYRRGMYTYFWRATPYPSLTVFDAPETLLACTRRNRSNTPLQALTLLNDGAFVEQAQGLARKVLREVPADDARRIQHAFQLCLSRAPAEREHKIVQELLDKSRLRFANSAENAALLAADDFGNGVTTAELAAWTTVARALLNLDEFITRE